MSITLPLIPIIIVVLILSMVLIYREWNQRERKITDLEERIQKLESASQLRLPYVATDELLNAMAVLDVKRSNIQIELDYIDNIKAHITNAMTVGTKRETKKEK